MKNRDYWRKRFDKFTQALLDESYAFSKKDIERLYNACSTSVQGEIAKLYIKLATNNKVGLQDVRKLLNDKELKEFRWTLKEFTEYAKANLNDKYTKQLINASAKVRISHLEATQIALDFYLNKLSMEEEKAITEHLESLYEDTQYHTAYEIQKGIGVYVTFVGPTTEIVTAVLNKPWASDMLNFSDRIWRDKAKLFNVLNDELTRSLILGEDPQKAINNISKRLDVSKRNAGRLVMTESAAVIETAQMNVYGELGVERYEILVTLDTHTCARTCAELDKKVFDIKDFKGGVTAPPFHPNCRCCTAPYIDSDVGTRIYRDANGKQGYVDRNMTYKEWRKHGSISN